MAGEPDQVWIGDLPEDFNDEQVATFFGAYGEIKWSKCVAAKPGKKASALVQFTSSTDAAWFCENLNGNIAEGLTEPIQVQFSKNQGPSEKGKGKGKDKGKDKTAGFDAKGWGKAFGKAAGGKAAPAWGPYDGGKGKGKDNFKGGKGDAFGKGGEGKGGSIKGLIKGAIKGGYIADNPKPDENCVYVKGLPADTTDRDLYELFAPFGAIAPRGVYAQQKDGVCCGVGFVDFVDQMCTLQACETFNGMPTADGGALLVKQKNPRGSGKDKGKGKK